MTVPAASSSASNVPDFTSSRSAKLTMILTTILALVLCVAESRATGLQVERPLAFRAINSSTASDLNCTGVAAISPRCNSSETGYKRDAFSVGGRYITATSGSDYAAGQLYVEKLTPLGGVRQPYPLVFFHGGGSSGVSWLNTPDNRPGFASYFIEQGYQVYILDQASVGRSTQVDLANFPLQAGSSVLVVEEYFTAPEVFDLYPQSVLHTQRPGTGLQGDPYFDQFQKTQLPFTSNTTSGETAMRSSGCELLRLVSSVPY